MAPCAEFIGHLWIPSQRGGGAVMRIFNVYFAVSFNKL